MSYTQYTKCVPIGAKKYPAWAPKPTSVLVVSSIAVLIVPYLALIEIPLLITYCPVVAVRPADLPRRRRLRHRPAGGCRATQ